MRFPWLQVGADVISAKAGDLGVLLGCSRREAMGLLIDLWAWVLTRSPDDTPPDGVVRDSRTGTGAVPATERAVSWAGPEGMLITALEELGFVERLTDGLRFRGVERYAATWEKNRRRKQTATKPERNRTGTGEEPTRKTQTQTQTQKEDPASQANAAASPPPVDDLPDATDAAEEVSDRPALVLVAPVVEKPTRKPSAGEALFARLEASRQDACRVREVPFLPSNWAHSRINRDLGPIARMEASEPAAFQRFRAAWQAFVEDEVPAQADVPYALNWFWKCRDRYEGRALREAP